MLEFDEYKGDNIKDKISNFKNLIYKFIDNDTIKMYLLLEQMVIKKKQEIIGVQIINDAPNSYMKRSA